MKIIQSKEEKKHLWNQLSNFPHDFIKYQMCISRNVHTQRRYTHAIKQTCSYSLPGPASCRKANIGLGGLGGAVWIRKLCGCERALFSVLSPRRLNRQRRSKSRFHSATSWDAPKLRGSVCVVQDKFHLVHMYFIKYFFQVLLFMFGGK